MSECQGVDPCADVLDQVYEYLNGEITEQQRAEIRGHLEACPPCLRQYGLEKAVKELLSRSCCREQAPETLRVSIIARIREIRVTYRTDDLA